jgi:hypothetical protein
MTAAAQYRSHEMRFEQLGRAHAESMCSPNVARPADGVADVASKTFVIA